MQVVSKEIINADDINSMKKHFLKTLPDIGAFDTETTGLNIKVDKPFLFQFGYYAEQEDTIYTYIVDFEKTPLTAHNAARIWTNLLAPRLDVYLAHNATFDIHMMSNIGHDIPLANVSDFMYFIRAAHDNKQLREGGAPLALKPYATKYIDPEAKLLNKKLDKERTAIAKAHNAILRKELRKVIAQNNPDFIKPQITEEYKKICKIIEKVTFEVDALPEYCREPYNYWRLSLPDFLKRNLIGFIESENVPYNKLDRRTMYKYAHKDIVLPIQGYFKTMPTIKQRGTYNLVEKETSYLPFIIEMEKQGFKMNIEYLLDCKIRMKGYIEERFERWTELIGAPLGVGQHKLIKRQFLKKYRVALTTTNMSELGNVLNELKDNPNFEQIKETLETLKELRTLNKWYSTYLLRYLHNMTPDHKIYTTLNQVGAVTGRFTSDFQQAPKKGLLDIHGEELFNPRRAVIVDEGFDGMIYMDLSQIELRLQAIYTILVGDPDLNMLRAYMPYQCSRLTGNRIQTDSLVTDSERETFDYNNPNHLTDWNSEEWYLNEDPDTKWTPTDLHAETTKLALGIDEDDPNFKDLRSTVGKRVNFSKNYGAGIQKMIEFFPEYSIDECKRINNAYYQAFPGVKSYHTYAQKRANGYPYTENLFGVKYYGATGHKLANMLVQGSAAYFLKERCKDIYNYMHEHNMKSKMVMTIHDEIVFNIVKEELPHFIEIKKIMETLEDTLVPIVSDVEYSETNWAEKEEVNLQEVRNE